MKDNLILFTRIRSLFFQLLCSLDTCPVSSLLLVGLCSLPACVSEEEQTSRLKILLCLIALQRKAVGWTCSTPGARDAQESVSMGVGVGRAKLILQVSAICSLSVFTAVSTTCAAVARKVSR